MATVPTIRIFKAGTFQDVHGATHSFAASDLDDIVASYDPAANPAPLVIGHPQHDEPAYGWVGQLRRDGDTLVAEPSALAPGFAEAVRDQRYRKVSSSFYPPTHPANPTPGRWQLKHVGFLGAAAPAVKGLGTVQFNEAGEQAALIVDFEESPMSDTPTPEQREAAFAEREAAIAARETAITTREGDVVEREATMIAAERLATHNEHVAFAEAQVGAGRLAPAGCDKVVVLLDLLGPLAAASFAEGEADERPVDVFRGLLAGAAPVVSFAEVASPDVVPPSDAETPEQLAGRAVSFMEAEQAAGREITIQAAVRHCHQNPPAA